MLTWDNLLSRGFIGPRVCPLCRRANGSVYHLLVNFSFTAEVWAGATVVPNTNFVWCSNSLLECVQMWLKHNWRFKELPLFISWEIWKSRNALIFEDQFSSPSLVCSRAISHFLEFCSLSAGPKRRLIKSPLLNWSLPVGFFDGANKNSLGGADILLHINCGHICKLWMSTSLGSNNKAKLLACWGLLWFAR